MTTTYSVTLFPSRPAGLAPDRCQRTLGHLVADLASHGDCPRPVRMTVLPVRARLSVEAPAIPQEDLNHLSHLHDLSLRMPCDGLRGPVSKTSDERFRIDERGEGATQRTPAFRGRGLFPLGQTRGSK
jgi:hypothetical protein